MKLDNNCRLHLRFNFPSKELENNEIPVSVSVSEISLKQFAVSYLLVR